MTHQSTGKLIYDPRNEKTAFRPWWLIVQCDRELVRYYQHVFYRTYWKRLQTPAWGAHISLVRGEEPLDKKAWRKWQSKTIEFKYCYTGQFESNGQYYWLKVRSPNFAEIREELGLKKEPMMPFHLSIGSLQDE